MTSSGASFSEDPAPSSGGPSRERAARPGRGKTDEVDALAIARLTARDPDLPAVRLTVGLAADLRLLLDYRQGLVYERHALVNQAHAELSGLVPGYQHAHPHLKTSAQVTAVLELLDGDERVRAEITRRRLNRVLAIAAEAQAVRKQITDMVAGHADHVAAIYGAGPIIAARFLAEVVDIDRYPTRDAVRLRERHRTPGGLIGPHGPAPSQPWRQPPAELRALHHGNHPGPRRRHRGRAHHDRKRAEGKTAKEAIRCLKRQLSD